ncbi:MAG TPA: dockerin type I repeat-containing protein [Bacteroidales bacterium]|nr:dockerin type I repeat-containing protein [Bacteroidales bacterium]HNS46174.1 dockerin type I repeat-containing protein [Bacteroidales bacterium]
MAGNLFNFRVFCATILFFVPVLLKAQLPPGWDYIPSYSSHIVAIPLGIGPTFNGVPMTAGDHIGVFYDDDGELKCAGAVVWNATASVSVSAYGDDPYETGKQGFNENDSIYWKLYHWPEAQEADGEATWQDGCPGCTHWDGRWHDYGLSALETLQAVTFLPGDANGDGIVNVLDVITVVNYIMELNPPVFFFNAADVTVDGVVNVLDIIGIVNIIMET